MHPQPTQSAQTPQILAPSTNPNQALWEKGDFTRIAATMRASGAALVAQLGIARGTRVLDLGCGDGTTALPAAQLGAQVVGIDIARNLVEAGNRRAAALGLAGACTFQVGDAIRLAGVADASFDLVVSIFGAMFAPDPIAAAREMVRVTRPGGRIVMGNWIPGDPTLVSQVLRICSGYTPPPPAGAISPIRWGDEGEVRARFAAAGIPPERVAFLRDTFTFVHPGTPADLLAEFRTWYGPTMNAFAAAENAGRAAQLQAELEQLFADQNRSGTDGGTVIPATFLRVTVRR